MAVARNSFAGSPDRVLGGVVGVPEAKLRAPRPKPADVTRNRLLDMLATQPADVLSVLAPGGYGKSTLVSQWATRGKPSPAWISLDPSDSDPVVLVSSILRSLQEYLPDLWGRTVLTGDEPALTRRILPRLGELLGGIRVPITLVFDDLHHLEGDAASRVIGVAVDALPDGSRVALVGRAPAPGLPIARWRGIGRLAEIGAAELAFDAEEAEQVVTALAGTVPSVAAIEDILTATRGWPVAVYLQARTGRAAPPVDHFEEYLDEEVLPDLAPDVLAFLQETAILSALAAPLCDAVRDGRNSHAVLARAERESRLVTRLDGTGQWYRLHPLVRDRLARQFEQAWPERAAAAHSRAAGWFRGHSLPDEAIRHAVASGADRLMADAVWEASVGALLTGQRRRVTAWLDQVPPMVREQSAELAVATTWAAINGGDGAMVTRWGPIAAAALARPDAGPLTTEARSVFGVWVAVSGTAPFPASAVAAEAAFAALPAGSAVRPLARLVQGWSLVLAGDSSGADLIVEAGRLAKASGVPVTEVQALALEGLFHLLAGDVPAGLRWLKRGWQVWTTASLEETRAATLYLAAVNAYGSALAGDETSSRADLAVAAQMAEDFTSVFTWTDVFVGALAAMALAALGDRSAAQEALAGATAKLRPVSDSPFLSHLVGVARDDVAELVALVDLTPAEVRVWHLLQTRMTQREIAEHLVVSPETVKTQTAAVYRKLGVSSRREAQELGERIRDHARPTAIRAEPRGPVTLGG